MEDAWGTLADLEPGESAIVRRVSDRDPERLRYLEHLGLIPLARLEVLEKAPFNGPLTLRVGSNQHVVGHELASEIRVEQIGARRNS